MNLRHRPGSRPSIIFILGLAVCLSMSLPEPALSASTAWRKGVSLQPKKKAAPPKKTAPTKKRPAPSKSRPSPLPGASQGLEGQKKPAPRLMSEEECVAMMKARPPVPLTPRCLAVKNVNEMLKYIYDRKHYTRFRNFVPYFNSSILKTFVLEWLPLYNVTILAPTDSAYAAMKKDKVLKAQIYGDGRLSKEEVESRLLQVMAFHVWFPRSVIFDNNSLGKTKPGDRFTTACYPQKDIWAYRLNTTKPMFNGRMTDTMGATPGKTVYYDGRVKGFPIISVIEVNYIMTPRDFF